MIQINPRLKAANELAAPSMFLIIVGALSVAFGAFVLLFGDNQAGDEMYAKIREARGDTGFYSRTWSPGPVFEVFTTACSLFVVYGAWKMRSAEKYRVCKAAAIVACIPLLSPCCILGVPFGVWALVLLSRPEIKKGFSAVQPPA